MSEFLDDLARSLAQPMPRRRALVLLGRALVAAALPAVLRPAPARANSCQGCTDPNLRLCRNGTGQICSFVCCPPDQLCCTAQHGVICCNPSSCYTCGKVVSGQEEYASCVPKDGAVFCSDFCCRAGQTCCGSGCCPPGTSCCGGKDCCPSTEVCSRKGKCKCKKGRAKKKCGNIGKCCKGETCCGGADCCAPGETCCDKTCCATNEICCGNFCCDSDETCCGTNCCPF